MIVIHKTSLSATRLHQVARVVKMPSDVNFMNRLLCSSGTIKSTPRLSVIENALDLKDFLKQEAHISLENNLLKLFSVTKFIFFFFQI